MKKDDWIKILIPFIVAWIIVWVVSYMPINNPEYLLAVPVILTVLLLICIKYFSEPEKVKYFEDLLYELKQNKRLAEKEGRSGYNVSAYEDIKKAKYLLDLSGDLSDKIGDIYTKIFTFHNDKENVHFRREILELKKLLEDVIPKFEEYLKKL